MAIQHTHSSSPVFNGNQVIPLNDIREVRLHAWRLNGNRLLRLSIITFPGKSTELMYWGDQQPQVEAFKETIEDLLKSA